MNSERPCKTCGEFKRDHLTLLYNCNIACTTTRWEGGVFHVWDKPPGSRYEPMNNLEYLEYMNEQRPKM